MPAQTIHVETDFEQVQLFCKWAERYKSDFDFEPLKRFQSANLRDVFNFLIANYHEEEGEVILRPQLYYDMTQRLGHGLDCDDAFIFMTSLLRSVNVSKSRILVVEVSEPPELSDYVHIYPAIQFRKSVLHLDNLPGSKYGFVNYDKAQMRVTRFSDYV